MNRDIAARLFTFVCFVLLAACAPVPPRMVAEERPSATPFPSATVLPSPTAAPTVLPISTATMTRVNEIVVMETAVSPTVTSLLPTPTRIPATATSEPPIYTYCAAPNETLATIAAAANVSEAALREVNGLGENGRIMAAQRLQLPLGSTPPHQWTMPVNPDALSYDMQMITGIGGYYLGQNNRRMEVALTFDIGFNPDNLLMMAYLAEQNAPSTFFLVGANGVMIEGVLQYGHELANHSWTHADLTLLSEAAAREEMLKPARVVPQQVVGADNRPFFRPPFGAVDDTVRQIAAEDGWQLVNWTVDSGDWRPELTTAEIAQNVMDGLCPGAIVVLHGNNGRNFAALPIILEFMEAAGYEAVTLSQLMR